MANLIGVIGATFGLTTEDVSEYRYQCGHTSRPIYAIGDSYFAVSKTKPKDNVGGDWVPHNDQLFAKQKDTVLWVAKAL